MIIWIVIPILLLLLIWLYMFILVNRAMKLVIAKKSDKFIKRISIFISFIIMLPTFDLWGITRLWMLIIMHIAGAALLTEVINLLIKKIRKHKSVKVWNYIYSFLLIPIVSTVIIFTYGYINMRNIVETDYTIYTSKNIKEEGYKVALLADIHYGTTTDHDSIQKVCDRISNDDVDMVVLCGDIVDESTSYKDMQDLFSMLGKIKSTYGTYYVYGNHDKATYSRRAEYTEDELASSINDSGIKILDDKIEDISDDFVLVGRKDRIEQRLNSYELLSSVDRNKFILAADHQPKEFKEKAEAGIDLQVSGHTHAGQIFPMGIITRLAHTDDYVYGMETVGNMKAVVTSGISGWGFPIRTEAHSEYVILNIMKEEQ